MLTKRQLRGVIFDLDGVLVDTEYFHWRAWVKTLEPFKVLLSKNEYSNYIGKNPDVIDSELIKKYGLKIKKGELVKEKKGLVKNWFENKELKLMPYAREAIDFFSKKGLKMGVGTGGSKHDTIIKLKKMNLYSLFPVFVTADDVEREKPHPDTYLLVLRKLGLKPNETIVFEDTQSGLSAAKSAGLTCFVIPNEYSVKQDFSKADKIFSNFKEVIEYFS